MIPPQSARTLRSETSGRVRGNTRGRDNARGRRNAHEQERGNEESASDEMSKNNVKDSMVLPSGFETVKCL